jgi:cell wall assembly regulator SMI1
MQKFTRALTREIEVGGERLSVTLDQEGLTLRPVGSRRPPHTMTWTAVVCACAGKPITGDSPPPEVTRAALDALKAGRKEKPAAPAAEPTPPADPPPAGPKATAKHSAPESARGGEPAPAAPPADQSFLNILARIDHWLARHRPRFHKALLPGATDADLAGLEGHLGMRLPGELRDWLRWHSGQDPESIGAFEEGWILLGAGEIGNAKSELDAAPPPGWHTGWVPFLDNDNGSYLCLDTTHTGLPVRACWRGNEHHEIVAPSLTAWARDFAAALEAGQYHEDPERGTFHRRGAPATVGGE